MHRIDRRLDYVKQLADAHGGLEKMRELLKGAPVEGAGGLESLAEDDGRAPRAQRAVEAMGVGARPERDDLFALEAIIDADLRPAIDIIGGSYQVTHPMWLKLNETRYRNDIEQRLPAIGRIELPGHPRYPYGGTGFVVGKGLVMTNRHVAEIFARGLGTQRLVFRPGAKAGIDFVREQDRPGEIFDAFQIVMIHPYWDMALIRIKGIDDIAPLPLSAKDARELRNNEAVVVGYPAYDSRNPHDEQHRLFDGRYGIKRLQPGMLLGRMQAASFGKFVDAAIHDMSTLGGNSGSALLDLGDEARVVALHFGGSYHEQNYAVPMSELLSDARVLDAGIDGGGAPRGATPWNAWWTRADAQEVVHGDGGSPPPTSATTAMSDQDAGASRDVVFEVPLRIAVSIGESRTVSVRTATAGGADEGLEAMRDPWHDDDYASRTGYDHAFLDEALALRVPMPTAADTSVLATTIDGSDVLHYENFSIRMHAKRRLALVTASNVTREAALRRPEAGRDYSRRGLSGLGQSDQERWFEDTRLEGLYQLPDVFFTKDRKAFDKGHLVRRDDVAWGADYATLRRANGDTYHVTNCSPQVAPFNQSAKGEDNWGDLENHVLSEAGSERLCVFAGPVLADDDDVFIGRGDNGATLRSRIPRAFWKVIVARVEDGLAAFGFVLEQDLGDVQFEEFVVPPEFLPVMTPISEIAEMTGVQFDDAILEADQFGVERGDEVVYRSGVKRWKSTS